MLNARDRDRLSERKNSVHRNTISIQTDMRPRQYCFSGTATLFDVPFFFFLLIFYHFVFRVRARPYVRSSALLCVCLYARARVSVCVCFFFTDNGHHHHSTAGEVRQRRTNSVFSPRYPLSTCRSVEFMLKRSTGRCDPTIPNCRSIREKPAGAVFRGEIVVFGCCCCWKICWLRKSRGCQVVIRPLLCDHDLPVPPHLY